MAIAKKTLEKLATLAKVKLEDLEAAQKDAAEKEIEIPDGLQTFTTEELTTRDENNKTASKSEHIRAGKEIMIKELKTKAGLEYDGKDPETFVTNFKEHVIKEAKINPDARVKELESQVTTLRGNISNLEKAQQAAEANALKATQDARILASLPANRNKDISDADYLLLVRNRMSIETVDGKELIKDSKGEVIRDKIAGPKALADALTDIFGSTTGWISKADPKGGRGGGSSEPPGGGGGGEPKSYSEAEEAWKAQGKHVNEAGFSTYVASLAEKNKDFVMDIGGVAPAPAAGGGGSGAGS